MTNTIVVNGVTYQKVTKVSKKPKTVKSAEATLNEFMTGFGFKAVSVTPTEYTRKDGTKVPAKRIVFSNKKSYLVTATRFWKE